MLCFQSLMSTSVLIGIVMDLWAVLLALTDVAQQRVDLAAGDDHFLRPAAVLVISVPVAGRRTTSGAVHPAHCQPPSITRAEQAACEPPGTVTKLGRTAHAVRPCSVSRRPRGGEASGS